MRGSDLSYTDLLFAGATSAASVLIFSPAVDNLLDLEERRQERQTADVATVLTAMRLLRIAPSVFTCVDLHDAAHVRFFRLQKRLHRDPQPTALARVRTWASSSRLSKSRLAAKDEKAAKGKVEAAVKGARGDTAGGGADGGGGERDSEGYMHKIYAGGRAFSLRQTAIGTWQRPAAPAPAALRSATSLRSC